MYQLPIHKELRDSLLKQDSIVLSFNAMSKFLCLVVQERLDSAFLFFTAVFVIICGVHGSGGSL